MYAEDYFYRKLAMLHAENDKLRDEVSELRRRLSVESLERVLCEHGYELSIKETDVTREQ